MSPEPCVHEWEQQLLEKLADWDHTAWAHWTRHLLQNLTPENIARWGRQIETPYVALSQYEQELDRKEAREILAIVRPALRAVLAQQEEKLGHFLDILTAIDEQLGIVDTPVLAKDAIAGLQAQLAQQETEKAALQQGLEESIAIHNEAFGVTQDILGLEDAGDDPDDLVPNLRLIDGRRRHRQQEHTLAEGRASRAEARYQQLIAGLTKVPRLGMHDVTVGGYAAIEVVRYHDIATLIAADPAPTEPTGRVE